MDTAVQVAAFEGGKLRFLSPNDVHKEIVLALPLSRIVARIVKVPADANPIEFTTPILSAMSPFPDEPLTVSCEEICTIDDEKVVIAAALPESSADDIGEALDAAKVNVVRIDALAIGLLRGLWGQLGDLKGRRLVIMTTEDCTSLIVLDGDCPVSMRAVVESANMRREILLSLLEAEDFGGQKNLEEIVIVGGEADETFSSFAPVRKIEVGEDAALVGINERSQDADVLNILPASWGEMLNEARFKAKMFRALAIAGGIWLLIMSTLICVPMIYGMLTDHQKSLSKQHQRQYRAVSEMKAKVDLIHKYSDHARGALEIMKAISDRLPEGITLSSWDYRRDDGVRVKGDSTTAEAAYAFKDAMDALVAGEDERIFGTVILTGPNASKGGYAFNLDCQYKQEEDN